MSTPLFVIGSSNTDMVVKTDRLPAPGETLLGGTFLLNAGGKGANQAVAAARLGGSVSLVARVGNDIFGQKSLTQFQTENIDTRFISTDAQLPSGVALINVDAKGENSIVVAPGSNARLTPDCLRDFFIHVKPPALVLVQLEIPLETVEFVVTECKQRNIPVILNPAPAQKLSDEVLRKLFVITPNETEAQVLTGIAIDADQTVQEAAIQLLKKGIQHVIITLGKRGAYWTNGTEQQFITSPLVTAIDTTAAGDCFNGALATALAEGQPMPEAIGFACKAASISVTRMGAQAAMPFRKEIT